jgi:hypothetical protein
MKAYSSDGHCLGRASNWAPYVPGKPVCAVGIVTWKVCEFQPSATVQVQPSLLWNVTQCLLVVADVSGLPLVPIFKGQSVQVGPWDRQAVQKLR